MDRWEDTIRVNLIEMDIITSNLVGSSQDRSCWRALVNYVLNFRAPEAIEIVNTLHFSWFVSWLIIYLKTYGWEGNM